jgi:hypothetical protein
MRKLKGERTLGRPRHRQKDTVKQGCMLGGWEVDLFDIEWSLSAVPFGRK